MDIAQYKKRCAAPGLDQTVWNRFVSFTLAFLFAFNLFAAEIQTIGHVKENHFSGLQILSSNHVNFSVSHPTANKKLNIAIEDQSEVEEELETDDSYSYINAFAYFFLAAKNRQIDQTLSILPAPVFPTRMTVPLFIQFHSWKIFAVDFLS